MRTIGTTLSRALPVLLVSAVVVLAGVRADAQVNPLWDHYKVYQQSPVFAQMPPFPVYLSDQFGATTHQLMFFEWFATPVDKTVTLPPNPNSPIHDPLLHYAWWKISPQPFGAIVVAVNQFGDQTLHVREPVYLLNPALKNEPTGTPLPVRNHYKCYLCDGQSVDRPVQLVDQFDTWNTTVTVPRFFCNPTAKTMPGGQEYPIVDPLQHYVCYELQPTDPGTFSATMTDQVLANYSLGLHPGTFLCVPTYKTGVVSAIKDTWGRLKMLYR